MAKNDPENWALDYGRCTTCNSHWCDRCMARLSAAECPKDQTKFTRFGATPEKAAPPPPVAVAASSTRPWWKFWG